MANFVVGDIQGCYSGLRKLLDKVAFDPSKDKLWAVGDLIGRGPEAEQTLAFFCHLGDQAQSVLGNHDLHFLAICAGIKADKASNGFARLLNSPRLPEYQQWLRQRPLVCLLDKRTLLCHAGLYPQWSFKQAVKLSDEISQGLRSDNWQQMLSQMYGNTPAQWTENLKPAERQRFIINAFTRMRYVSTKLSLDFTCKTHPVDAPVGLQPWFACDNRQIKKKQKVIFGHWAALAGQTHNEQYIGLDTGYIWGGSMTALHVEKMQRISIAALK